MSRDRIVQVAVLAAVLLVGLAMGAMITFRKLVQPIATVAGLVDQSYADNEAYVRYRYGSYPVAKAALLDNAERLKQKDKGSQRNDEHAARVDLGLTYGRLAVAAERAGFKDEAASYMKLAVHAFSAAYGTASEKQVREGVEHLDRSWDRHLLVLEGGGDVSPNPSQSVRPETNRAPAPPGLDR